MSTRARAGAVAAALIAGTLTAPPILAQTSSPSVPASSPSVVSAPAPTSAAVSQFAQNVGINITCAKAYLAANNNAFPQSLSALTQFMVLAPAADLCSPGAVASAVNNTPAPTDAQQAAYAQSVGVNASCIKAFVLHANSLPLSLDELNQFRLAAPPSALCTNAAITKATS